MKLVRYISLLIALAVCLFALPANAAVPAGYDASAYVNLTFWAALLMMSAACLMGLKIRRRFN